MKSEPLATSPDFFGDLAAQIIELSQRLNELGYTSQEAGMVMMAFLNGESRKKFTVIRGGDWLPWAAYGSTHKLND